MFFAIMHGETQGYKSACHMVISVKSASTIIMLSIRILQANFSLPGVK